MSYSNLLSFLFQEVRVNPENYKLHINSLRFSVYEEIQHKQANAAIVIIHIVIMDRHNINC